MITLNAHQQKTLKRLGIETPADQSAQQLADALVSKLTILELDRDRWRLRVYAVYDLISTIRAEFPGSRPIMALADALERAVR